MKKMNNKIVSSIFLVTLLSSFFVISTVLAEVETYNFITKWGTLGSNEGQFNYPSDITVDNNGYVYVLDKGNNRVQKFSNDGTFIMQWGTLGSENGQFNYTMGNKYGHPINGAGITVDTLGNVYVADPNNDRVQKFNSNGIFLTKFNASGSIDVAVDKEGNLYLPIYQAENRPSYNNSCIQKFNSNGVWLASWNNSYSYPERYFFASIAIDNAGYVYVLDISYSTFNGIVQRFDSNGILQNNWRVGEYEYPEEDPFSLTVDNEGFVYVVAYGAGMQYSRLNSSDAELVYGVNKYTNSGKIVTRWGNPEGQSGSGDGEFAGARGVVVDSLGNVFVADTFNHRIQKFTKIPVVPEFSSTLILPLFITLTLLTSIIYFKKHKIGVIKKLNV